VLDNVALLRPHNERLVGSYAVPGISGIGVLPWPPTYDLPAAWKDRKPVNGFRLAPGKKFAIALGVEAPASGRATSKGLEIYYHDSVGRYVIKNNLAMVIGVNKSAC